MQQGVVGAALLLFPVVLLEYALLELGHPPRPHDVVPQKLQRCLRPRDAKEAQDELGGVEGRGEAAMFAYQAHLWLEPAKEAGEAEEPRAASIWLGT